MAVSIPTQFKLLLAGVPENRIVLIEADIDRRGILDASTKLLATDLLYAGRLISTKNVELIIEAVAILAKENFYVTASIVGDGSELENLLKLTEDMGVANQITFHGFLDKKTDVWGLMKKCAIFISPSSREGFGFSVIEAHFAGAQVLINDHPNNSSNHYLNGREGVTVVKNTGAQTYADAIKTSMTNLDHDRPNVDYETVDVYQKYEKSWMQLRNQKRITE